MIENIKVLASDPGTGKNTYLNNFIKEHKDILFVSLLLNKEPGANSHVFSEFEYKLYPNYANDSFELLKAFLTTCENLLETKTPVTIIIRDEINFIQLFRENSFIDTLNHIALSDNPNINIIYSLYDVDQIHGRLKFDINNIYEVSFKDSKQLVPDITNVDIETKHGHYMQRTFNKIRQHQQDNKVGFFKKLFKR